MNEFDLKAVPVDGPSNLQCACGKAVVCGLLKPCTNKLDATTAALAGTEGFKSFEELEDYLVQYGGVIVNVNSLTAYEIAAARTKGHLYLAEDGTGFAWQPSQAECDC